jgi:hypothetical protein
MKRSASEIIRNLEMRIARLERQSARLTPKHFLEMMESKHEDYFLGLDHRNTYTKQLLNFAKERMVKGSEEDKENFILNIEKLSRYLNQESMIKDLDGAIIEIVYYMGMNGVSLNNLEYTWKVGLTDRSELLYEYKAGKEAQENY